MLGEVPRIQQEKSTQHSFFVRNNREPTPNHRLLETLPFFQLWHTLGKSWKVETVAVELLQKKKDVDQKRGWNTGYQIEPEKLCFGRPSRLYVAFFCPFSDVLLWLPINLRTKILKLCLCNSFIVSLVPERSCRSPLNSEALYVLPRHGPRWLMPFIL